VIEERRHPPGRAPPRGISAATHVLSSLCKTMPRDSKRPWHAPVDSRAAAAGGGSIHLYRGGEGSEERLRTFLQQASAQEARILLSPLIEHDLPVNERGETPTGTALLGFFFQLELAGLYRAGGPLHDELSLGAVDENGEPRLTAAHWQPARTFMGKHLRHGLFRPTIVLEQGWIWHVVFAFPKAWLLTDDTRRFLYEVRHLVGKFLYASHPYAFDAAIRIDDLIGDGHASRGPMRLLWIDPRARHGPRRMDTVGRRLLKERTKHAEVSAISVSGPAPPEMGLLTLPPDWTLKDWALGLRHKQILTAGLDQSGAMGYPSVGRIVEAAARRGHGWLDAERLLADPRYTLNSMLAAGSSTSLGLKRAFRKALATRDHHFRTRLPWGIRIELIPGHHPGEPRRYRLHVRNEERWLYRDVPWVTLCIGPGDLTARRSLFLGL